MPCPHCASSLVEPPDEFGDKYCLACGEYMPQPRDIDWRAELRATIPDEPVRRGRPPSRAVVTEERR